MFQASSFFTTGKYQGAKQSLPSSCLYSIKITLNYIIRNYVRKQVLLNYFLIWFLIWIIAKTLLLLLELIVDYYYKIPCSVQMFGALSSIPYDRGLNSLRGRILRLQFHPWSRHIRETSNQCLSLKLIVLDLSTFLSLSKTNKQKSTKMYHCVRIKTNTLISHLLKFGFIWIKQFGIYYFWTY